ncbi:hypothetical protein D7V90_07670 [bacterium 1xD42-87]|nr:hypothetical protein D7V90_07670 [bacterium 1xD42-87]
MKYIKGKGILVGTYNENDLKNGKDKIDVLNISKETGFNYTNNEFVKRNGKIVGIKIYVCKIEDFKI